MKIILAVSVMVLAVAVVAANTEVVVTLGVVQDNTTWSAAPDAASPSNEYVVVRDQAGTDTHAYIEFDLSGLTGYSGAEVQTAMLNLYVEWVNNGGQACWIKRIAGDWDQNSLTWNNAPAVAEIVATTASFGTTGWKTVDITDLVKDWLDGTHANEGVRLSYAPSAYTHQANITSSDSASGYGSYIEVAVVPEAPSILDLSVVPDSDMLKMIFNVSGSGSNYFLRSATDLVASNWTTVVHSYTNDAATLSVSNLDYSVSDASGTNKVVYLQADIPSSFYKIVGFFADSTAKHRDVTEFGAVGDGLADDSDAIQAAIAAGSGITYFPSGTYRITKPIHVWGSYGGSHLIGDYSGNRPTIVLDASSSGFGDVNNPSAAIVFHELGPDNPIIYGDRPAWVNTFSSQLDGIDLVVEVGNPGAIAIDFSGAQCSYIRNCEITLGSGYKGIHYICGDSVYENVVIEGGQIGIEAGPYIWPATLKGCEFRNQTLAGVLGNQQGIVFEGCVFDGCDTGIYLKDVGYPAERLYLEDCIFKNIGSGNAIDGKIGARWENEFVLQEVYFDDCTNIVYWRDSTAANIAGQSSGWCRADYVTHGVRWENGVKQESVGQNHREVTQDVSAPVFAAADYVAAIPNKAGCVSVKDFGAVGDGATDDTLAISNAIASAECIWFPMGTYVVSDTIQLQSDTKLIGEHSKFTMLQLVPNAGDGSFDDPMNPKPLIDTVDDPNGTAVFAHFRINAHFDDLSTTGVKEFEGLIGARWRVGSNSVMDDVMNFSLSYVTNAEETGYCALYVTGSGGGEIRQVANAWDYCAAPGEVVIEGTSEPLFLYGVSSEHEHTKPSYYLDNADNVTIRQGQSEFNHMVLKAVDCSNLAINNLYYHLRISYMEGNAPNSFAMEFVDCTNVDLFCFWRYWYEYYDNILRWTEVGVHEDITGSSSSEAAIAAYRRN
ncbi:MAG: glycosyl hydrolase family 28-related protein [Verrucomicrobiota bacterium]